MNRARPPLRAFAALLLLPLAFWLRTRRRPTYAPPSNDSGLAEEVEPSRRSVALAFVHASLLSVGIGVAILFLWIAYDRGTPALTAGLNEGELYLFFDQPGVVATIRVDATSDRWNDARGDHEDDLLVSITIRDLAPGQSVGYAVSLSGTALPSTTYPAGGVGELDHRSCPQGVSEAVETCYSLEGDPEGWAVDQERADQFSVLVGTIKNENESKVGASASFWVVSAGPTVNETGELREFQLPRVGRAWLPDELLLTQAFELGPENPLFVPASLAIAVEYDELGPTESLDAVDPSPVSRRPLAWVEGETSSIAPSGTISDARVKRDAERGAFLIGVLAGVAAGFIPAAFTAWRRVFVQAASRRR